MDIGYEIKQIRQAAFLSQEAFAIKLGAAFSTVNRWETGKSVPNCTMMKKIVDFCKEEQIDHTSLDAAWKEHKNGIHAH